MKYIECEIIGEDLKSKIHFFDSYFMSILVEKGANNVQHLTKRVNVFDKSFIIVPIHSNGNHWCVAIICNPSDNDQRCIMEFDSLSPNRSSSIYSLLLREFLANEFAKDEKKTVEFNELNCPYVSVSCPQQKNCDDCGVFMLQFVEDFLKLNIESEFPLQKLKTKFNQNKALKKRGQMADIVKKLTCREVDWTLIDFSGKKMYIRHKKIQNNKDDN